MTAHREKPLGLALLPRLFGLGEFIESVSENQAAIGGELAAFGAEVVDRLARRATPAPGAVDQFADAAFAFHAAHDRSGVADLDVLARRDIGSSLGHRDLDLEVVEIGRASCRERVCQYG